MRRTIIAPYYKEKIPKEVYITNKLISEFMYTNNGLTYINPLGEYSSYNKDGERAKVRLNNDDLSELKYHSSWDWLMPVKEKIEIMDCISDFSIGTSYICIEGNNPDDEWNQVIYINETSISKTYKIIIDFIEWYNRQKS